MNPTLGILAATAMSWLLSCAVLADDATLDFSCVSKRVEQKTTTTSQGEVTINTEDWEYVVTLENKTFKDMANLDIKYLVFFKQEELGSTAGARFGRKAGSAKIDIIKGNDKAEFNTTPVTLQKASLSGFRYYSNGAKPEAEASLAGLWVRIYQNGILIAEIARPSNLPEKEKWAE